MQLKTKNKVFILKYKILFEEQILVKNELEEGTADLVYHLDHFRKKLKKSKPIQDEIFSKMFFGNNESENNCEIISKNNQIISCDKTLKDNTKLQWAKKLYKKIVYITHPDKTASIKIPFIVEKFNNYYTLAVSSYNNEDYHNLIMLAFDLEIEFDENLIDSYIKPQIQTLEKEISSKKHLLGYQWHHIPEDNKVVTLENYLTRMGFIFTKDDVVKVIRKAKKRKVGPRPVKSRRMKLK